MEGLVVWFDMKPSAQLQCTCIGWIAVAHTYGFTMVRTCI